MVHIEELCILLVIDHCIPINIALKENLLPFIRIELSLGAIELVSHHSPQHIDRLNVIEFAVLDLRVILQLHQIILILVRPDSLQFHIMRLQELLKHCFWILSASSFLEILLRKPET